MSSLDWGVLVVTLAAIVGWGLWKERGQKTSEAYLRGGGDLKWWTIGLSIMATQASAITFLSVPGQGYEDGMGYVQFYLGLPVAMVILSAFIVPIYYRLKVYTAYEWLETRFDRKTRQLTALLFLLSRGLAAGVSISAPAIVLATVLGWPLRVTSLALGVVVILYTVIGGTRIVSRTQTYQMVVMLGGMAAAAAVIWGELPATLSLSQGLHLAGALGKMKVIDYSPRFDTRYTFWSGMTGGLFVALAYFGTDQSQVQRYLGGESLRASRFGLLFNGLFKVPMQFLILFIGVMLFLYFQFHRPPVFFDATAWSSAHQGSGAPEATAIDEEWASAQTEKEAAVAEWIQGSQGEEPPSALVRTRLQAAQSAAEVIRQRAHRLISHQPGANPKDSDYIFLSFVVSHFPRGLVGLLLAVILCAAMSAVSAALSSLGTTSVVDFYRLYFPQETDGRYLAVAKLATVFWGILAVLFAALASQLDNLIQAVNILGSIFYGPMLGVFGVGFFMPRIRATPVFAALVIAQIAVVLVFALTGIGFLWYNVIGCGLVVAGSSVLNYLRPLIEDRSEPNA